MKNSKRPFNLLVALTLGLVCPAVAAEVHQATGFKVVNVTSTTADIWTRVTRRAAANPADGPLPRVEAFEVKTGKPVALRENRAFPDTRISVHLPERMDLGAAAGGAPAATGQTRVRFRVAGAAAWSETPWQQAGLERDGIVVHALSALVPAARYELVVQARRNAKDGRPDERATAPNRRNSQEDTEGSASAAHGHAPIGTAVAASLRLLPLRPLAPSRAGHTTARVLYGITPPEG